MATNHESEEQPKPESMLIDRYVIDLGRTEDKKELGDTYFSMKSARLAFLRPETNTNPPPTSDAVEIPHAALKDQDAHPWMQCCGRNFTRSIFSLQPSRNPKPGFTRRRRCLVQGRNQNAP